MKIDFGDFLVFTGAVLLLGGLYLFDWRLALIAGGLLLMILGSVRLKQIGSNHERT